MTSSRRLSLFALVLPLFALPASLAAAPEAAEARGLLDRQRQLSFVVSRELGSRFISLEADFETAFPVTLASLVAILLDYDNIPKVFSRVGSVKVLSRSADVVLTEQRSGVKVLGIEFYATSLFANRMRHDDPESIRFDFDQMDSGGNVENCRGYWSITDFSSPGLKLSYVRYRVEFEALAQYPGQESIMRNLGAGDIERTMRELGLRAVKRAPED